MKLSVLKSNLFGATSLCAVILATTFNCYAAQVFKDKRTWKDLQGKEIEGKAWKTSGDGIKIQTVSNEIKSYPYSKMSAVDKAHVDFEVKQYVKNKMAAMKQAKKSKAAPTSKPKKEDVASNSTPKEDRISTLRKKIDRYNKALKPVKGLLMKPAVKYQVSSRWVNANGGYYKPTYAMTKADTISVMISNGGVVGYPNYPQWYYQNSYREVKLSPKSVKDLANQQQALRMKKEAEAELQRLTYPSSSSYSSSSRTGVSTSQTGVYSRPSPPSTKDNSARIAELRKKLDTYNGELKPVKGLLFRPKNGTTVKESVSVMISNGEVVGYPRYPQWYYLSGYYSYHTVELSPKSVKDLAMQKDVLRKKQDVERELRYLGY